MKNFKTYILFITGFFLFMTSCLHEEEDVFGKSAAERLNEAQKLYADILTRAQNGWSLEYLAGNTDATKRGAFNFLLKFADGKVTAAVDAIALSDIDPTADPYRTITSLYKLEQDMGVTLSFDSYNPFLHYYHEQHGSYTTYKGDYEFTILEATGDLVVLRGKKYGNIMEMHRLPDNVSWKDYLGKVNTIYEQAGEYPEFKVKAGNREVGSGSVLETKQFSFTADDDGSITSGNAIYTTTGIKFVTPMKIDGKEVVNFAWNYSTGVFTCTDPNATDIAIAMFTPDDYTRYADFIGSYTLTYTNQSNARVNVPAVIEEKGRGRTFTIKGFGSYEVTAQYNKQSGTIAILSQQIGTVGANTLWLAAWDSNAGYVTWGTAIGMNSVKDISYDGFRILFADNRAWGSYTVRSYILWQLNSSGASAGAYTATTPYRFINPEMVKK